MKAILVDFATPERPFEDVYPIGVLLERGDLPGFESRYLESVTEDADEAHDNYVRTQEAVQSFRDTWERGEDPGVTVGDLFRYLADTGYLGLRFRTVSHVGDDATLDEVFERYVVRREPLPEAIEEEIGPNV